MRRKRENEFVGHHPLPVSTDAWRSSSTRKYPTAVEKERDDGQPGVGPRQVTLALLVPRKLDTL